MRYVVLLRYGLGALHSVLRVNRSEEGEISCTEVRAPRAGMTWSPDGRFQLTTERGITHTSLRRPLAAIREPLVAYALPGRDLLDERFPLYASDIDQGATVQLSAHAVLEEPHRVELQLILVPRGDQPHHRETVGDRRIDDGDPDIWVVLDRFGHDGPSRVAAAMRMPYLPPLRTETRR